MINIDKLYNLMADDGFKDHNTGNLFFPAYIYSYPPEEEYEMREQIKLLIAKLKRPNNYLDSLDFNIYHELINYLKGESFAGETLFESAFDIESKDPEDALSWVRDEVKTGDFYDHFENKIREYFNTEKDKRVYLIVHGFGSAFPYIRASELLKRTEKLIKEFKIIVFYPGKYEEKKYHLFNILDDDNMYRANNLNIQLGEN